MKSIFIKVLSKYLSKKAGLYEGTPKQGKVWYKSTTVLSGIVVILRGLYEGLIIVLFQINGTVLQPIPPIVDMFLLALLGGETIKGRVNAHKPITLK